MPPPRLTASTSRSQFLQSFGEYPPPAKAGVGGIEKALEVIQARANAAGSH